MEQIKVARLVEQGKPLEVGTADKPVPGPRDVLVKVAACGLVPNSYNIVNGHTPFPVPQLPAVFGLDVAGTVEAVGSHVVGISPGQRVYIDPYMSCETCHHCRRGRRDICMSACLRGYMSFTPNGEALLARYPMGGLSEYVVAPDTKIVKLPDQIGLRTAAHFGYAGTSFAALRKGGLQPGHTVLINGVTGTLGVLAVAIALGMGASKILGVGRNPELLERVRKMAPGRVETASSEDGTSLVEWALAETDGVGVDVLYDCLGVGGRAEGTQGLLKAMREGARAVLVAGGVDGSLTQSYIEVLARDVHAVGSNWFLDDDIDRMVSMVASGTIDLSFLVDHVYPLDRVNEAFEFVGARPGGFANVVVVPSETAPR